MHGRNRSNNDHTSIINNQLWTWRFAYLYFVDVNCPEECWYRRHVVPIPNMAGHSKWWVFLDRMPDPKFVNVEWIVWIVVFVWSQHTSRDVQIQDICLASVMQDLQRRFTPQHDSRRKYRYSLKSPANMSSLNGIHLLFLRNLTERSKHPHLFIDSDLSGEAFEGVSCKFLELETFSLISDISRASGIEYI